MAPRSAPIWLSEKVGTTFLGAFGIFTLTKGVLSIIASETSQDQKALMERR